MKTLLAWELGSGLGHTMRLTLLAEELKALGHDVSYALREPKSAEILKFEKDANVFQAPAMGVIRQNQPGAIDYAELLLIRGYENENRLDERLRAWMLIFDEVQPDNLITDHAPSARLAAHIAGIPSHLIGDGFAVPPKTNPLRTFLPITGGSRLKQIDLESRLDKTINKALSRWNAASIDRAIDVFIGGSRFLCTVEELDNYGERVGDSYFGPVMQKGPGISPEWPSGTGPCIFIYLYANAPILPMVLDQLKRLGIRSLAYIGGPGRETYADASSSTLRISSRPINLQQLSGKCDLVFTQGGIDTLSAALFQGIPVLTYPRNIQQLMLCHRLPTRELGKMLKPKVGVEHFSETVLSMFENEELRKSVLNLSQKYKGIFQKNIAKDIASLINQRSCRRLKQ